MANNILSFPRTRIAESHRVPQRTEPPAEQAACNRPRLGLPPGDRTRGSIPLASPSLELTAQIGFTVARINLEIANHTTRDRLRRLFAETVSPAVLPA